MIRRNKLTDRFQDKDYRETYVEAFLNSYIAAQIRALRESRQLSQTALAELIGTKQPGVSKLEDVNYYSWNINTLKKLAKAFDVALVVKFVSFGESLSEINNFSVSSLAKPAFAADPVFRELKTEHTSVQHTVMPSKRSYTSWQFLKAHTMEPRIVTKIVNSPVSSINQAILSPETMPFLNVGSIQSVHPHFALPATTYTLTAVTK